GGQTAAVRTEPAATEEACPPTRDLFLLEGSDPADPGGAAGEAAARWQACQLCTHLMSCGVERASWTGQPVPRRLSETVAALDALAALPAPAFGSDSLARIVAHCEHALTDILKAPRSRLRREHRIVPLYRARDIDTRSWAWLARQPGRTTRERLGSKQ